MRALSYLYKAGSHSIQAATMGGGVSVQPSRGLSSLSLGVFGSKTAATQQSMMAQEVAPPTRGEITKAGEKNASRQGTMIAVGMLFIGGLLARASENLAAAVMVTGFLYGGYRSYTDRTKYRRAVEAWNETEYPRLLAEWEASALCLTCGTKQRLLAPGAAT